MTAQNRTTLYGYFQTGDKPTESQFSNLIDSSLSLVDTAAQTVVSDVSLGGTFAVSGKSTLRAISATTVSAATLAGLSTPLSVAQGGTGVVASDPIIQRAYTNTTAVATGTTQIPIDDTIPQSTEGNQYLSLAITPKNTANILVIEGLLNLSNAASAPFALSAALFQDSTANALTAVTNIEGVAAQIYQLYFKHVMAAGTTSATTFTVRAGANVVGTTTLNGQSGARIFGGTLNSYLMITEYAT